MLLFISIFNNDLITIYFNKQTKPVYLIIYLF